MSRRRAMQKKSEAQCDPNAPFMLMANQLKAMSLEMRKADQASELDFLHSLIVGRLRERFTSVEDAETINNFEAALEGDLDGSAERADATAKLVMMLISRIPDASQKAPQVEDDMKARMMRAGGDDLAPEVFERRLVFRQVFYYMAADAITGARPSDRPAMQRVDTVRTQQIQVQPQESLEPAQVAVTGSEDIRAPDQPDQPSADGATDSAPPTEGSGETATAPTGGEEPSAEAGQQQQQPPEGEGEAMNGDAESQKPDQEQEPLEYPPKTVDMAYRFGPVTRAMQNEIDYTAVDVLKADSPDDISEATDAQFLNEINLALNLPPPDYRNPLIAPIDIAADDQSRTVAQVKSKFIPPSKRM